MSEQPPTTPPDPAANLEGQSTRVENTSLVEPTATQPTDVLPADTTQDTLVQHAHQQEQNQEDNTDEATKKFSHDQAFGPWFWKNRQPGLRKLLKARKFGKLAMASAAVGVDYLSTNIVDTDLHGRYSKTIEAAEAPKEDAIKNLSGILMKSRREAAEQSGHRRTPENRRSEPNRPQEIIARIEDYNKRFHDPLYVPSPEEYEEMLEDSSYLHTYHTTARSVAGRPTYTENKLGYIVQDVETENINALTARTFLDAIQERRWKMPEEELRQADLAFKIEQRLNFDVGIKVLQEGPNGRRAERSNDFLNYAQYRELLKEAGGSMADAKDSYYEYLQQRVDLDKHIRDTKSDGRQTTRRRLRRRH